jgi:hypothetical protein
MLFLIFFCARGKLCCAEVGEAMRRRRAGLASSSGLAPRLSRTVQHAAFRRHSSPDGIHSFAPPQSTCPSKNFKNTTSARSALTSFATQFLNTTSNSLTANQFCQMIQYDATAQVQPTVATYNLCSKAGLWFFLGRCGKQDQDRCSSHNTCR